MSLTPTNLEKPSDDSLRITWSDGSVREYKVRELRDKCPCATCREKRSQPAPPATELPILKPGEGVPVTLVSMRPAGNYAYNIRFSDGHDSGIFTFDLLQELGQPMV